jgi:hypothetical protein
MLVRVRSGKNTQTNQVYDLQKAFIPTNNIDLEICMQSIQLVYLRAHLLSENIFNFHCLNFMFILNC